MVDEYEAILSRYANSGPSAVQTPSDEDDSDDYGSILRRYSAEAPSDSPSLYDRLRPILTPIQGALNLGGAGSGAIAGALTGALGSDAYGRALEENLAAAGPAESTDVGFFEAARNAPGAGQVLAEALFPGVPQTAPARIAKRVGGLVGDIATDPANLITGGLAGARQAARAGQYIPAAAKAYGSATAGLAYAPEIVQGTLGAASEAKRAYDEGDLSRAGEYGIEAALMGALGGAALHGVRSEARGLRPLTQPGAAANLEPVLPGTIEALTPPPPAMWAGETPPGFEGLEPRRAEAEVVADIMAAQGVPPVWDRSPEGLPEVWTGEPMEAPVPLIPPARDVVYAGPEVAPDELPLRTPREVAAESMAVQGIPNVWDEPVEPLGALVDQIMTGRQAGPPALTGRPTPAPVEGVGFSPRAGQVAAELGAEPAPIPLRLRPADLNAAIDARLSDLASRQPIQSVPKRTGERAALPEAPADEAAQPAEGRPVADRTSTPAEAELAEPAKLATAQAAPEVPLPGITTATVKRAFAAGDVRETSPGTWEVSLPGDRKVTVRVAQDGIEYDASAFSKGYGRELGSAEQIVGSWQKVGRGGIVTLAKVADDATALHESFHAAMDLALSPKEKKAVLKKYGSEESAAEAYGKWQPGKQINGYFSKILAFFRNMYRKLNPSWESAFERTRSGEAYGGKAQPGEAREAYASRPTPGQRGLPGVGEDVPTAGEKKRGPEQTSMFGGEMLQGVSARTTEGREAEGPLFTQEAEARAKAESEAQGTIPERTADTMSEAIALSSPNGRMSGRAREAANERLREKLFGNEGLQPTATPQPTEAEALLRQARDLRDMATRGMSPRKYIREAERLEAEAAALAPKYATAPAQPPNVNVPPQRPELREVPKPKAEPLGRPMVQGEAPRVETKVADLGDVAPGVRLSRDAPRTWESLDPAIQAKLNDVLESTDKEQAFYNKVRSGRINDVEVQAMDAIRSGKREAYLKASDDLKRARLDGKESGETGKAFLEAALDDVAADYARAARSDVEAGTKLARALAARARVMKAAVVGNDPDELLRRVFREIENVTDDQAAGLVRVLREDPDRLSDALHAALRPKVLSKFLEAWKAGLVSAPGTQIANVLGNVGDQTFRLGETAIGSLVDKILPGARQRYGGEVGAEVRGGFSRFGSAMDQLGSDLRDIATLKPEQIDLKQPLERQTGAIGGKTGRAVRIPFRLLGTFDNFFKAVGGDAELAKLAFRKAGGDKAKAAQIIKEALDLNDPKHAELLAEVAKARQSRTFQAEPGNLMRGLMQMRANHPWLHVVLPFLQTPANIASLTIQRSPFGFFAAKKAYSKWQQAVKEGKPSEDIARLRGQAVDAIARPLLGTAVIGAFTVYAKAGGMTGSGPTDDRERNLLRETGWQPYSFVVKGPGGKNVYIPFNRFEPVSSLLGFAADMAEVQNQKKAGDVFDKALGSIASNLTSKTYLQGLADAVEFVHRPQESGSRYVSSLAGSLVPNIIAKGAQALDPKLRETRASSPGLAGIGERVGRTVASRLPGVSTMLAERRSGTGEAIERPGNALSRFALPVQATSDRPGKDLERLLVDIDAVPSAPSRDFTIPKSKGKRLRLTDAEYKILQDADKQATERLRRIVNSSAFRRMDPEDQKRYVERLYADASTAARKKLYRRGDFMLRARRALRETA